MAAAVLRSGKSEDTNLTLTGGGGGGERGVYGLASGGGGGRTGDRGGGGYSAAAHLYQQGARLRDLTWDDKVRTLKDFVATYRLPLVARVRSGDLSKFLPPCQPYQDNVVQIHEVRRRKIVLARRLQWEKRQNDYIVSGEQVEVPASFKGWFEVVPDDGRPVEYFDTVGGICSIKPRRFLVRTSTVGYQLSIEDGVSCWMPYEIRPGEVLTTGMVYMDNNNNNNSGSSGKKGKGGNSNSGTYGSANTTTNNNSNKGFFKRLLKSSKNKNKPEQDLKYLQCFDVEGKEIMIPLIMSGVFSPVGDASMANYDAVYELQDLIMAFGLPVNTQLIHANMKEKASCPQGVLRLYGTREEELAVISRVDKDIPIADPTVEKVEVSIDRELTLQRGLPRRRQSMQSARPAPISTTVESPRDSKVMHIDEASEQGGTPATVELPKRVPKELKKSKSSGILDKLSVRKVRKERAKLKELRSDDVFSKRIIRNELSYEDFFNGLDGAESEDEGKEKQEGGQSGAGNSSTSADKAESSVSPYGKVGGDPPKMSSESAYGTYGGLGRGTGRKFSMQDRDLPPIPVVDSPPSSGRHDSSQGSRDSLYEHLPPAPQPPHRSHSDPTSHHCLDEADIDEEDDDDEEEDGYMVPRSVRGGGDSAYSSSVDVQLRRKPPAVPRDIVKFSRLKKSRSEILPSDRLSAIVAMEDDGSGGINIDDLFNFNYSKENADRPYGTMTMGQWTGSTSQLYGFRAKDKRANDAVPAWREEVERHHNRFREQGAGERRRRRGEEGGEETGSELCRSSLDKLDLETRSTQGSGSSSSRRRAHGKASSRGHQQNVDANATIRSHNLRKARPNLLELFHFSDSFRDLRDENGELAAGASAGGMLTASPGSTPSPGAATSSPGVQYAHRPNLHHSQQQSPFPSAHSARGGGVMLDGQQQIRGENYYGTVISPSSVPPTNAKGNTTTGSYFIRPQPYVAYADSEPAYRRSYPKAASVGGLSDSAYPKQGDDSAISMGSRGENPYGFNNDSEYSYNEYTDNGSGSTVTGREDNWYPPDDISALSVHEVSRSLRYIGMKDRVVLRFANEQIDGSMLCSLDKRLLKEGFPELNALEIKKILDFVRGWRPKKR